MKSAESAPQSEAFNVGAQKIARVYAEAYLASAEKEGQQAEALGELETLVADILNKDARFETMLSSAALGRHAREDMIRKAFEGRVGDRLVRFLLVLNEHDRLDLLRSVARGARDLFDEKNRRVKVFVTSAAPLANDQLDSLKQVLRDRLNLDPVLETKVDPDLLGGLKVRVGDIQYDGTVRTRIEHIRQHIIERGSHEIQVGRDRFSSDV